MARYDRFITPQHQQGNQYKYIINMKCPNCRGIWVLSLKTSILLDDENRTIECKLCRKRFHIWEGIDMIIKGKHDKSYLAGKKFI